MTVLRRRKSDDASAKQKKSTNKINRSRLAKGVKRRFKRLSIRNYIVIAMVSMFLAIFSIIAVTFNMAMGFLIRYNAYTQLNDSKESWLDKRPVLRLTDTTIDYGMFQITRLGARTMLFMIDKNYNAIGSIRPFDPEMPDDSVEKAIAAALKQKNIVLESEDESTIKINGKLYFYTIAMDDSTEATDEPRFMIFYVDNYELSSFVSTVNKMLFLIIGAAILVILILSPMVSGYIANPIRELSMFAQRIGQGDFTKKNARCLGREMFELNDSMNSMVQKLETYDKEQKVFFQNASHELRTPLMSIKCYAEGIHYGVMDTHDASKTILYESDRLNELIESLLYISRIDNITQSYEVRRIDLRELLASCAERQKSIAGQNGISVEYDFDDKPVSFTCAEKFMGRAFSNLISNAIRFAAEKIILKCRKTNDTILISVSDDGSGISEQDLPYIFDRFYKGSGGKHGIGLSIVKSVFDQYNGEIVVENLEKGVKFEVRFKTD